MNRKQKIALIFLFLAILINSLFELIGIALISPVVTVLQCKANVIDFEQRVSGSRFVRIISFIFQIKPVIGNADNLLIAMLCTIIFIYVIKAAIYVLVNYLVNLYTSALSRSMSSKMIKAYLSMPYDYFVNTNSAIIINKCTGDVANFTSSINGIANTAVASFTAIFIFIYLIMTDWLITLVVMAVMCLAGVISVFVIRKNISRRGKLSRKYNIGGLEILHRCIYGIKETKISRSENFFIDQYYQNTYAANKNQVRYNLLAILPSVIIQNFGIIVLMFVMMFLVIFQQEAASIITLLTTLVVAITKLLPNINIITANAVSFIYFKPSVERIINDTEEANKINQMKINRESKTNRASIIFNHELSVDSLSFKYEKSNSNIIDDVNLTIKKGEYVAISGKSGAGKTTLVDNILGLLVPQKGDVKVDGKSIYDNIDSYHALLSYVPQNIYLLDDTVKANICFGLDVSLAKDEDVWKALEKAQLKEVVEAMPDKLMSKIGEAGIKLSGGQRQRIGIARAFFRNTPIIVLDEATSSLDYQTEGVILDDIRKNKADKTIIIITHRLNTISACDHIFCIENHKVSKLK